MKIKGIILCLLAAIFLFAGCQDYSQEVRKEVPEAPAQMEPMEEEKEESLPLEIPVRDLSPEPVEEEEPITQEEPVRETPEASPEPAEEEDPAPPEPAPGETPEETPQAVTYVLNTNTMKFHKPSCRSVKQIKPKNRLDTMATREDVVAQGYSSCGICHP